MKELADAIVAILHDYHKYLGFQITPDHVLKWVSQFNREDQEFILSEYLHILKQGTYVSEERARKLLFERVLNLAKRYKYKQPVEFLANVDFLLLQPVGKSQPMLLKLLDEELQKNLNIRLDQCGSNSHKHAVYLDDILATGGTLFRDMDQWLKNSGADGNTNLQKLVKHEITLDACYFCVHNGNLTKWRLKVQFNENKLLEKINITQDYEVQNHLTFLNQKFNFAYPVEIEDENIKTYFAGLDAKKYEDKAYRAVDKPNPEAFFSSPDNRKRLEHIFLCKGVELLMKAGNLKANHRPLGATFPSYKTFGTGTLFFTWRNISNTCPVVFWWDAGVWYPLFPLQGRGVL